MLEYLMPHIIGLEKRLDKIIAAPTFPIYAIADFPQDAIEGQIAIGDDNNLYWFSSGMWNTIDASANIVTLNSVPQDVVEGQIVVALDGSGIAWYFNGNWYGLIGGATTGNPPQDAVDGQVVIGNADNLCYYINGQWYTC